MQVQNTIDLPIIRVIVVLQAELRTANTQADKVVTKDFGFLTCIPRVLNSLRALDDSLSCKLLQ